MLEVGLTVLSISGGALVMMVQREKTTDRSMLMDMTQMKVGFVG